MIKVTLIALGKLKEAYLRDAVSEYTKRLSRYCDLEIIELEPIKLPDSPSKSQIDAALLREAEMIIKKIPKNCDVYPLCVEGKQLSSEEFAEKVDDLSQQGRGIVFIIGSSYGLSETVKATAKMRFSLSKMTFPHQLFRVMLLEQVYRAFKINEGSTYHK
ncbi:MAG: 23S rRNA (pseudouridine(1915)-N(3))-methyltransferase RlmH [Clostridia bacterium]|nr:23S rRNA (pseudouridine(1915)-N(3))-methyltransferase RlmH [Clostridia bacterium]